MKTRKTKVATVSTLAAALVLSLASSPAVSSEHEAPVDELLGEERVAAQVTEDVLDLLPRGRSTFFSEKNIARATEQYWSQERMDAAKPMGSTPEANHETAEVGPEFLPGEETDTTTNEDVSVTSGERVVSHPVTATKKLRPINPMPRKDWVNGKLFMTDVNGQDWVCSASAVNSSSKRMIATAAHCLYSFELGEYHKNVVFKGGYKKRNRPSLSFTASYFGTLSGYRNNGDTIRGFWSDIGFAYMRTNWRGMKVVDAVGGHGMVVGSKDYTQRIRVMGYPSNYAGGNLQRTCVRNSSKYSRTVNRKTYNFIKLEGCNFAGGSSGSPYLVDYNKDNGKGYITAVNSWGPAEYDTFSAAPLFRKSAEKKYNWVNE